MLWIRRWKIRMDGNSNFSTAEQTNNGNVLQRGRVDSGFGWKEVETVAQCHLSAGTYGWDVGKVRLVINTSRSRIEPRTRCNCKPQIVQNATGYSDSLVETFDTLRRNESSVAATTHTGRSVTHFHRSFPNREMRHHRFKRV